ncbi:hypothetical protein JM64_03270 [Fervidobacterium ngatamarikiense]|uniref:Capsule synthesis protein CapA domain-containing protein n=1 Tax=Fervidobacterium pennivorans TaxID=93466 RepID=A0A172T288_FERPE|nr:CapA family protein [Fervidobacterium pennivorans]ANE41118.1 hypothetical protein JM64_03270 [Fervidobacterium pennivorans]
MDRRFLTCVFFIFFITISLFGMEITLSFVGDIMFHKPIIDSALSNGKYDFKNIFKYVKTYIEKTDLAFCNLETTLGGKPYTGYPRFSSPDEVLDAIKYAGFDVVNVANNHMLDRGASGLIRTIKKVSESGLTCVGARLNPLEKEYTIVDVKDIKVSLASFTYSTNGIQLDKERAYMFTYISKDVIMNIVQSMRKESDIVIVYLHYGNEYQTTPTKEQRELAHLALKSGADLVIASHPHVLQEIELVKDGLKTKLIAYSLGNFLSNMTDPGTDEGVILNITYHKVKGVTQVTPVLTLVQKYYDNEKLLFRIIPVNDFIKKPDKFINSQTLEKLYDVSKKNLMSED